MDMLHMPDRRTGASPGARKTTILSYFYFVRVQWFINRRNQHGLIYAKFGSEAALLWLNYVDENIILPVRNGRAK